jgi:(1->4)-alpha-D-glucan 1-alpha-D-glucosylmutase
MTPPSGIPRATIRLQFHRDFTFRHAADLAPYFAELGVSHVYGSPILKARAGSVHGYDITDHGQLNPELGDAADFDALIAALHANGLGLILDFVPNHMGVGGADNPWWLDVLEWGPASPFARFFDIDWGAGGGGSGPVLLPILGDHYGVVLERGELELRFDARRGAFAVWYYTHCLPIAVKHYARLLRGARDHLPPERWPLLEPLAAGFAKLGTSARTVQRQSADHRGADELRARLAALIAAEPDAGEAINRAVAAFNGAVGEPASFEALHALLEEQHFRVAFWRTAADAINYRRFFDINDLAGLRIDRPEVFELAHGLVFRLIAEGKLQGLRLDHVDGLYDPVGYFERLQDRAAYLILQAGPACPPPPPGLRLDQPLYVVVEKILARHETLRSGWPVAGTTGYDFMNLVGGLFVDAGAEVAMTELYHEVMQRPIDYERLVLDAKRQTMRQTLASELNVLVRELHRLGQQSWNTRDHTPADLRRALVEVVACLPVYRTYIAKNTVGEEDRKYLDWAVGRARKMSTLPDPTVFDFLHAALTTDLARDGENPGVRGFDASAVRQVAMRVQQFSGPVTAKALEDTVFYRYVRLVSLNEVGGDPARFGVSPSAFHHVNQERQKRFPYAMLATATHDHKRGEDTRARIAVLTEMPDVWGEAVRRWTRMHRSRKTESGDRPVPGPSDEYLFYQTVVGAWPLDLEWPSGPGLEVFAERIVAYMLKAVREGKVRSSWTRHNVEYETALERFIRSALDPERSASFLQELMDVMEEVAPAGAVNGLAQVLLKSTAPGLPDFYQGTDGWDLSLVDPDNRRPIDYEIRRATLEGDTDPVALMEAWRDGRIKRFVMRRALELRRLWPALFVTGEYRPLDVTGEHAERVVAFLRRLGETWTVTVAPRLVLPLMGEATTPLPPPAAWGDTALTLPELPGIGPIDALTGRPAPVDPEGRLLLSALLDRLPVALLRPPEPDAAMSPVPSAPAT